METTYEDRYRDLFENANDMIQAVLPDGRFQYVNRAWREALGYDRDEVEKLTVFDVVHPDSMEHCMDVFGRLMSGDSFDRIDAAFISKDGRKILLEGSASCRFEGGKPVNTRGIFRNVTERKTTERKRNELLKDLGKRIKELNCLYGLSRLVERIVKVYGGEVRAYNDSGACFEFTIRDFPGEQS